MILAMVSAAMLAGTAPLQTGCEAPAGQTGATGQSWYINGEPVGYGKQRYTKYGLPRLLSPDELQTLGAYKGVPVMVEKGDTAGEVIYVLVVPAECSYQPYMREPAQ